MAYYIVMQVVYSFRRHPRHGPYIEIYDPPAPLEAHAITVPRPQAYGVHIVLDHPWVEVAASRNYDTYKEASIALNYMFARANDMTKCVRLDVCDGWYFALVVDSDGRVVKTLPLLYDND